LAACIADGFESPRQTQGYDGIEEGQYGHRMRIDVQRQPDRTMRGRVNELSPTDESLIKFGITLKRRVNL